MPVTLKKIGKKWRVVVAATGEIETNNRGTALDGGGHVTRDAALAQVRAINTSLTKRKEDK